MITAHKTHLLARCIERGYSIEDVMPCVVSKNGDEWTIDVDHPSYPKANKLPPEFASGPGTELKALLKNWLGIVATPNCSCNARARLMDENELKEPGWCEKNIETICDWLQEEATKRSLPFVRIAARLLVRRAIANARKTEARRAKESAETPHPATQNPIDQ